MVNAAKVYMLKLVFKLKANNSLKLLLFDVIAYSSILIGLEITGMAQNKRKLFIFIVVSQVRVENQIS